MIDHYAYPPAHITAFYIASFQNLFPLWNLSFDFDFFPFEKEIQTGY